MVSDRPGIMPVDKGAFSIVLVTLMAIITKRLVNTDPATN